MNAIDAGLAAKLGDATLASLAPGGVWQDVAPSATDTTHVIFSLSHSPDEAQLQGTAWEETTYLVKAVAGTKGAADAAADRIRTLLDGGTLTISGYTCMGIWREERVGYVEVEGDSRWYHSGGLFTVKACRT